MRGRGAIPLLPRPRCTPPQNFRSERMHPLGDQIAVVRAAHIIVNGRTIGERQQQFFAARSGRPWQTGVPTA